MITKLFRSFAAAAIAVSTLLVGSGPAVADEILQPGHAYVTDAINGTPIEGAEVRIADGDDGFSPACTTDATGHCTFFTVAGEHDVAVVAGGYDYWTSTHTFYNDGSDRLDAELYPRSDEIENVPADQVIFDISPRDITVDAGEKVTYTITLTNTSDIDIVGSDGAGESRDVSAPEDGAIRVNGLPGLDSGFEGLTVSHGGQCITEPGMRAELMIDCVADELPAGETLTIIYTALTSEDDCGGSYYAGMKAHTSVTADNVSGNIDEGDYQGNPLGDGPGTTARLFVICSGLDAVAQLESANQAGEAMVVELSGEVINAVPAAELAWTLPTGEVLASDFVATELECSLLEDGEDATFSVRDAAGQEVERIVSLPTCEDTNAVSQPAPTPAPTDSPSATPLPVLPNTAMRAPADDSAALLIAGAVMGVSAVAILGSTALALVRRRLTRRAGRSGEGYFAPRCDVEVRDERADRRDPLA